MKTSIDKKLQDDTLRHLAEEGADRHVEVIVELDIPEQKLVLGRPAGGHGSLPMGLSRTQRADDEAAGAALERVRSALADLSAVPPVVLRSAGAVVAVLNGPALRTVAALDDVRSIQPNKTRSRSDTPHRPLARTV